MLQTFRTEQVIFSIYTSMLLAMIVTPQTPV